MRPLTLLLVVDRRFISVDGQAYTEGPTGAETGERYLEWFDRVIVAGRRGQAVPGQLGRLNRLATSGHEVVTLPDLSGLARRARSLAAVRKDLRSLLSRCDAVVARLPSELGFEAATLAAVARKPCVIDVGGCVLDGMRTHGSLRGRLYAPLAYRRMRTIIGRAGWVAYVTQEFLQRRYPAGPVARTLACSDVVLPDPDPLVLQRRLEQIRAGQGMLTFGTIGSLYGQFKGIQHALAALGQAAPHLPDFRYRVLGGGDPEPWRRLANRLGIADRVTFDGVRPAGQPILEWLDGIDVYLQPSLREGLPRALIEAMSRATPTIASNIAGIPELVRPEWLHEPGDVGQLQELLVRAIRPAVREELARYSWQRGSDFAPALLQQRRDDFWRAFRDHAAHGGDE